MAGAAVLLALLVSGCSMSSLKPAPGPATAALASFAAPTATPAGHVPDAAVVPAAPSALGYANASLDPLIAHYSQQYDVPESLVHRMVKRESGYNPRARNGPYWGLMQIRHDTARTMGYSGSAAGLLDAETNLRYAGKYLRGAYMVGGYNEDSAVRLYSRGYYYDAKRQGLLEETGLR